MKAEVLDIWVGGDTQFKSFVDASKHLASLSVADDKFKLAVAYRKGDGTIGEITIRQYSDSTVYIESDIKTLL